MTVDDLKPCLKEHWPRIKEEILTGTYQSPASQAGGYPEARRKGVVLLGIPIVLDRFIEQAILEVLTPSSIPLQRIKLRLPARDGALTMR